MARYFRYDGPPGLAPCHDTAPRMLLHDAVEPVHFRQIPDQLNENKAGFGFKARKAYWSVAAAPANFSHTAAQCFWLHRVVDCTSWESVLLSGPYQRLASWVNRSSSKSQVWDIWPYTGDSQPATPLKGLGSCLTGSSRIGPEMTAVKSKDLTLCWSIGSLVGQTLGL